jgi:hypothetical protein
VGVRALAIYECAAKLFFEKPNGAGERRLSDIASLGGPGEVQLLAEGEEIADLMHLHGGPPGLVIRRRYNGIWPTLAVKKRPHPILIETWA